MGIKLFGKYDLSEVKVEDPGLKKYINLEPRFLPKSHGRYRARFEEAKIHIIERLINKLQVPGHRGKKHKIITRVSGKYNQQIKVVRKALEIIERKTGENPIQILVKAIENAAPHDEITTIEYGGARYPQAVDTSPLRRLNVALRNLVHGAFDRTFNKKIKLPEALAEEIMLAYQNKQDSYAIKKRIEMEKQADSAR